MNLLGTRQTGKEKETVEREKKDRELEVFEQMREFSPIIATDYENVKWELDNCKPIAPERKSLLEKKLKLLQGRVLLFKKLAELGATPTPPPTGWYAGIVILRGVLDDKDPSTIQSTDSYEIGRLHKAAKDAGLKMPHASNVGELPYYHNRYIGYMPPETVSQLIKIRDRIVGKSHRILVTSPHKADFETIEPITRVDPMAFVNIEGVGWFRVAQWNLSNDIRIPSEEQITKGQA